MSKEYFDNIANQWESMREGFFSEAVREKAYHAANMDSGKTAADIGAGSGFITEGLLKMGLNVIAVDQSEKMLEQLIQTAQNPKSLDVRVGDANYLPINNDEVDYVFANMCLHHVESPEKVIKEMARILKKGGKCIITDLDEHNFEFLRTEQHDLWMGFKREDIRNWFLSAGFHNVAIDCTGNNCCADSQCNTSHASVSIFLAYGEK